MALNPLSYSELAAWNDLTGAVVTPKEVQIIKALDKIFLAHQHKKGS